MSTAPVSPVSPQPAAEIEYATLRQELLNRLDARQQMLSIALTLAGAFTGIGWSMGAIVLLLYPLIALLLAAAWAQNEIKLWQLAAYIREQIEPRIPGLGWERYSYERRGSGLFSLDALAVGGILLVAQLLALGLGLYQIVAGYNGGLIQWILLALDGGAVLALLALINQVRASRG